MEREVCRTPRAKGSAQKLDLARQAPEEGVFGKRNEPNGVARFERLRPGVRRLMQSARDRKGCRPPAVAWTTMASAANGDEKAAVAAVRGAKEPPDAEMDDNGTTSAASVFERGDRLAHEGRAAVAGRDAASLSRAPFTHPPSLFERSRFPRIRAHVARKPERKRHTAMATTSRARRVYGARLWVRWERTPAERFAEFGTSSGCADVGASWSPLAVRARRCG